MGFLAPLAGAIFGGGAATKIAVAGIGAVGSALSARAQARAQSSAGQLDLGRLRAEAEAHGFNPLTVLNATGGAGFQSGPGVPGFLSLAAGMIGPAINQVFEQSRTARNDRIANALIEAQTTNLTAQTKALTARRASTALTTSPAQVQTYDSWGWVPAYTPTGIPVEIHGGVADRLGIKPGGIWIAEDDEAVLGDVGSVITQVTGAGEAYAQGLRHSAGQADATPFIRRGHTGNPGVTQAPQVLEIPPGLMLPPQYSEDRYWRPK